MTAHRIALLALLLAFIGLHGLYNALIPLGEGPDEPGHLAYVLFLLREQRLPVQASDPAQNEVPGEGHQPPLAYLAALPMTTWLPEQQRQVLLSANPTFFWAGGADPGAFRRGSREFWPWEGQALAWHLVRAVSGVWGLLTVAAIYLAARRLRPDDATFALLAASLTAFNPQFLFITALASNDGMLAALGALIVWIGLAPPGSAALRNGLLLGLLFGIALLTKQSALLFGPLLLWAGWRISRGNLQQWVLHTAAWGSLSLLIAGWWFLRNFELYGDLFGLTKFSAEFTTQPFVWSDPDAWRDALGQLFSSFWARFGWMSLRPPAWTIWVYVAVCGLAALGWIRALATQSRPKRHSGWGGPILLAAMAGLWIVSFALTAGLVAWQGRLLFPALAGLSLLLAGGLRTLLPAQATGLFTLPLLALAIWMPVGVIRPAYGWDVLRPAEALAARGTPTYLRFAQSWERGIELRGWRLDAAPRRGEALPITFTWHSLEPIPRSWTVFIHLLDENGQIVAETTGRPRNETQPFIIWTPGDWVDDQHILNLPAELAPGTYTLRVGLFRPEKDGLRHEVYDEQGDKIGDTGDLGQLVIGE
ncbi:MAG: hypothetical protein HC822_04370 [Oscillochloris sp.]|nr:hypothetical protein [Oscillochloris sp.]